MTAKRFLTALLAMLCFVFENSYGEEWEDEWGDLHTIINGVEYQLFGQIGRGNVAVMGGSGTDLPILETVEFGGCAHKVTQIAVGANFPSLVSLYLPSFIRELQCEGDGQPENPFRYCKRLEKIEVDKNNKVFDSRDNCNAIIKTSTNSLVSGCKNTIIPNSVTQIDIYAFAGCIGLTSISIPSSVTQIRYSAFDGCANLSDIYYYASTSDIFDLGSFKNTTLHVPFEVLENFLDINAMTNTFKDIVAIEGTEPVKYTLTYMIDNEVYKSYELAEGKEVAPEPAPTKNGYSFSGWDGLPETMPDHDVTVTGGFTINKYKLTYMVDGKEYKSYEVKYGSTIIPIDDPTKQGYTFSGWSEIPDEMPAHDVTITGTFTMDPIGKCGKPTITYKDGKIVFTCSTEGVTFRYKITCADIKEGNSSEVAIGGVYNVSVYATKNDYTDSETAAKQISVIPKKGDMNNDGKVNAEDVVIVVDLTMKE